MNRLHIIDTHTGGEPTRVLLEPGVPGNGNVSELIQQLSEQQDWIRTSLLLEPRGAEWMVGAMIVPPQSAEAVAGIVFFNNCGYLGMCGHGLIGVVEALRFRGQLVPGVHRFETIAGTVQATLHDDRSVSIQNVESYRLHAGVEVRLNDGDVVQGDIAYGGNWFFLAPDDRVHDPSMLDVLNRRCRKIRLALEQQGMTGESRAEIDHIELFAPLGETQIEGCRSYVLCPGGQHDRSPCGTGTSAKLACLAADQVLPPDTLWRQESMTGSQFTANYRRAGRGVVPTIRGRAFVTGETQCHFDPDDAFRFGILPTQSRGHSEQAISDAGDADVQ
ncbi:MAG: proline racemase family protein [Planctomycetota bacterium]